MILRSNHADEFVDAKTGVHYKIARHVSFVDCPGHDILMATMLNGAAVMDAAFLLVAGNESCPQPQTSEHLAAVEIMRLENIIILQNKVDLVKRENALAQQVRLRLVCMRFVFCFVCIVPACYQHVTSMLPACYQHVTGMLPASYQHRYQHVTSKLPASLPACSTMATTGLFQL